MPLIPILLLLYTPHFDEHYCTIKYLILAIAIPIFLSQYRYLPRTRLDLPIAMFLGSLIVSSLLSTDKMINFEGMYGFYFCGVFPMILVTLLYYCSSKFNYIEIAKWFVGSMVLVAMIGIAQKFNLLAPYELPNGRVYSTIGSPVFLSCVLGMAIPVAVCLKWWWQIAPLLACLVLTQSRSGLIGAFLGCLWPLLASKNTQKWAFLAFFLLFGVWAWVAHSRPYVSLADKGRGLIYSIAGQAIYDNPIFGIGPEKFAWAVQKYRDANFNKTMGPRFAEAYAHNSFLNALATTGIVGFLAYLFLLFRISQIAMSNTILCSSGIALLGYSMFQPTPFYAKAIYAMMLGSTRNPGETWPRWVSWVAMATSIGILVHTSRMLLFG